METMKSNNAPTLNQIKAFQALDRATKGKFNIEYLYGPALKSVRHSLLEMFHGRKVLKKDTGITILVETFSSIFKLSGNCSATESYDFSVQAKKLVEKYPVEVKNNLKTSVLCCIL